MGWDDKLSERELGDWLHEDTPDVDDATPEEEMLGSEAWVWESGSPLYAG
jgi:hypothetical protein